MQFLIHCKLLSPCPCKEAGAGWQNERDRWRSLSCCFWLCEAIEGDIIMFMKSVVSFTETVIVNTTDFRFL